jgi:hypothetical protein
MTVHLNLRATPFLHTHTHPLSQARVIFCVEAIEQEIKGETAAPAATTAKQ